MILVHNTRTRTVLIHIFISRFVSLQQNVYLFVSCHFRLQVLLLIYLHPLQFLSNLPLYWGHLKCIQHLNLFCILNFNAKHYTLFQSAFRKQH